tara:strand:+ start:1736 stop:2194 length:459 start_codon:yes stop_codon:yes gene_type:complete
MDNQKTISILNSFIIINNARINRYKSASIDSKESFLKKTFVSFKKTSLACKKELIKEIIKLGDTPIEEKSKNSLLHRFWLKFTKFVFNTDLSNIIYSCERNESIIIQSYYEAIYSHLGNLNNKQKTMLNNQYFLINGDHDKMKSLRVHSHRL